MQSIKIYPLIGLAAKRNRAGGSFRLWVVARHLDQPEGSGKVRIKDLKEYLEIMGVNPRTYRRWIHNAVAIGIFEQDLSGRFYRYKSPARTAIILGAKTIVTPVVIQDPVRLFEAGWIGVVWAGFLESLNRDRPVSRAVLEKMSGVPETTQRYYERIAGDMIKVFPSFNVIGPIREKDPEKRGEQVQHLRRSQEDDSYRIMGNMLVQQLPNVYTASGINRSNPGRSRKEREVLSHLFSGQQVKDEIPRLYYNSRRASERAAKRHEHTTFYFIDQNRRGFNWYGSSPGGDEYLH